MKYIFVVLSFLLLSLSVFAEDQKPKLACGKDRTTTENLQAANTDPNQKGTAGLIVATNIQQSKADVKTFYTPNLSYKEAAELGSRVDAFFWIPNSVMSFEEIKSGKANTHIMSCCSSTNGCSRCCNTGGCICVDTENGSCYCTGC